MNRLTTLTPLIRSGFRWVVPSLTRSFHVTQTCRADVKVIESIKDLRAWRRDQMLNSKTVGLVPTMGALHNGHLSLVQSSLEQNDNTVVSIFVNPSQFAPHEDLSNYPRTLETDIAALKSLDSPNPITVFMPPVSEMYPSGISLEVSKQVGAFVEVKGLSEQLEGSIRPHFFRGVATVVTKLINAVGPERIYFGQKDIQQVVVIKRMVKDLLMPTEVVMNPTVREENSLAMSSRNTYLSQDSRSNSNILYKALATGEKLYKSGVSSRNDILSAINAVLEPFATSADGFHIDVEYISISDKITLKEVDKVNPGSGAIISAAIRVPNKEQKQTRIIDNILLD